MRMERDRFEELCSAYVLGALEGKELQEFRTALAEATPELKQLFLEMQQVAVQLPLIVEIAEPSPHLKQRILNRVVSEKAERKDGLFLKLANFVGFNRPRLALAFSTILILGLVGAIYYALLMREIIYQRTLQLAASQSEVAREHQRFVELKEELARKDDILKVLQSPTIGVAIMKGLEISPKGYGKIIWDPDARSAILQVSNLPAAPPNKDYQLWVIKNNKPISSGVFNIRDPRKEIFFKIEQMAEVDKKVIGAFAITLEPKGGVPQPTGSMYLLGSPSL